MGLQPDLLPLLAPRGRNDGFIDRFLFAYPAEVTRDWSKESIDPAAIAGWERAVRRLWSRKNPMTWDDAPHLVGFTPAALERYGEWVRADCRAAAAEGFPKHLKGPWPK